MALQIRKVKEIPASSQLNSSNANIINNNNTAPKHTTKEDTKSHLLLRRSSRIDCHHSGEKKINSNVTTTPASTVSRTRLYLERSALKEYKSNDKSSAICSSDNVENNIKLTDNSSFHSGNQQICQDDNDKDFVLHTSLTADDDCCDDSVNLDLDIASNKSRIEKSNSIKRGKRSLSSTRVTKSNEKNIKRKTASDIPQQVAVSGKLEECSKKEVKASTTHDSSKSDHHMSLRLRKR